MTNGGTMENEFGTLTLAELFESKTNPRRHFDKTRQGGVTGGAKGAGAPGPPRAAGGAHGEVEGAGRLRAPARAGVRPWGRAGVRGHRWRAPLPSREGRRPG